MILHCAPPYWHTMPNAALGYLKGVLQEQGVPVKNVYWNTILHKKISSVQKVLANFPRAGGSFPSEAIIFFLCKKLLRISSENTILDLLFSSSYTEEGVNTLLQSLREDVDQYLYKNSLDREPLHGFTMKTYQWLMGVYLISRLKELNPDTRIIIGGLTDSEQARTFLKVIPQADYAIWGEGEDPLCLLAKASEEGTSLRTVPSLVYREHSEILSTSPLKDPHPLDSYPFADHSDYFTLLRKVDPFNKSVVLPIRGSRGCPWNKCRFCVLNEEYVYRVRSPENIVREMEYQSKRHRVDNIQFTDSDVAGNRKRFISFLTAIIDSMKQREKPYYICAEVSPLFIDPETANYMKRAGFCEVQAGFEAVTDQLLKKMQKRQKMVDNIQALKAAHRYDLPLYSLNVIRGIPTETAADVRESCSALPFFRFFLGVYRLEPTILLLLKGSSFYDSMSEQQREEWKSDLLWQEIASTHLIPEGDRFEFFSFQRDSFQHHALWNIFEYLLRFYTEQNYTYQWFRTEEGSLLEEKGFSQVTHVLTGDETDILVFCDGSRSYDEIKKEFSHLTERELQSVIRQLTEKKLLYSDEEGTCISVVEKREMNPLNQ
jgi:radical SAM superfamily enzyme YgiQ (UPF0313 family)